MYAFHAAIISIIQAQKCAKVLVGDPHQQIYGFKGATNAMSLIPADHTFHLTRVSYLELCDTPRPPVAFLPPSWLIKPSCMQRLFRKASTVSYCIQTVAASSSGRDEYPRLPTSNVTRVPANDAFPPYLSPSLPPSFLPHFFPSNCSPSGLVLRSPTLLPVFWKCSVE